MTEETQEELLSRQQQKAMHLFFRQLSAVLNERGLDMRKAMIVPIKPTERVIKEAIWKPIMFDMFGYKSTTQLKKKKDIDAIYDVIYNMFVDMKSGIIVPPFPSEESKNFNEIYK